MRIILTALFLLLPSLLSSQKRYDYSTSAIPESLSEKSVAVVRFNDRTFEISAINKATYRVKYAITILKKQGIPNGILHEYYDSFRNLGSVKATIYNASGDVIEKVKSSDILDFSAAEGFSIYEDTRQKLYQPQVKDLPYTVEYEFEYSYNGLFQYPPFVPVESYDIGVQSATFEVTTPPGFELKYLEKNMTSAAKVVHDVKSSVYRWSVSNIYPFESEEYSPSPETFLPVVYFAPVDFEISGFRGNFKTWNDFALWVNALMKGRDILSEESAAAVRKLVEDAGDEREKVKIIYNYMQEKTRYVSIQEGIGGWQPMPADEVDKKGYGDCKALSNYTIALLKAAGIRSHYVKVYAGRYPTDLKEEFVSNQSNHAFVCVPMATDTIWLECTNQTSPFGYIGNFTHGRKVLIVTEQGGKLVQSKDYPMEENLQSTVATVTINSNNVSTVEADITCTGLQYDNISPRINQSAKDNERWLYNNLKLNNLTINKFSFSGEEEEPVAHASWSLTLTNYCSESGARLFIPLNMFTRLTNVPPKVKERKREVEIRFPYIDIDTIKYIIPEKMEIEALPSECSFKSEFGEYHSTVIVNGREITYLRKMMMKRGIYPPESYNSFREFMLNVTRADNNKVVLKTAGQ